jgi:putative spermidine/putrescine transport system ATP-binding protein
MSLKALAQSQSEMPAAAQPALRLEAVVKRYGPVLAVDRVDLVIQEGEFFTLLGPSGSGKTTLLRLIAGFERPDQGHIALAGRDVTFTPPYARSTNTVFQDYALFPHMSVAENIGYGLKVKRASRELRRQRVSDALAMVRLVGLGNRRPSQLSGGQRQRVALARAIVNQPEVLLLDEPLGALDLKLRQEMQLELKRIQRDVGITFVYVTHDQEEALTMSDRVAVLAGGRIQQIGSPVELYERPANEFVAGFIGVSNILERDNRRLMIRPEKIRLLLAGDAAEAGDHVEEGQITEVTYAGMITRYAVRLDAGGQLLAVRQNLDQPADTRTVRGTRVQIAWRPEQAFTIPRSQQADDEPMSIEKSGGGNR